MSKQLYHNEVKSLNNTKEIIVIAENIRTPENVGMIFRVSEAFGCKQVYIIGDSPDLSNKKVLRTARSTNNNLTIDFLESTHSLIPKLKTHGFKIIGLEITDNSTPLSNIDKEVSKIALIVGAERSGISEETLKLTDTCAHINLYGKNSSINVVNALSIGLFELSKSNNLPLL